MSGENARADGRARVRVVLPSHLRVLARIDGEAAVEVAGPVTVNAILEALEERHPMLRGTIREHVTLQRRALVRVFACGEDISHESVDRVLPAAIVSGAEPLTIIGAIAGG